jgi:formylglycine-generating enzyme required for sulfatase activity
MNGIASERRRLVFQAVACVVLSASVGVAAGAVRPGARSARAADPGSPAPAPRQEPARPAETACENEAADADMLLVPAGTYRSFFKRGGKALESPVPAFRLDRQPVTRREFSDFVREQPGWQRSRVKRLFAEESYLSDFASDTEPGPRAGEPVTFVSWFAARAYCSCRGKRLPTLAEWERAATPDTPSEREPSGAPPAKSERLAFAMGGGARGPNEPFFGSVWEWTEDFDGAPVSGRASDAADSNLFCGAGVRAADASDYGGFLRYSFRSSLRAAYTLKNLGFRCAGDEP